MKTIRTLILSSFALMPLGLVAEQNGRVAWAGHPATLTPQIIEACLAGTLEPQKPADERIQIKDGQLVLPRQGVQ